MRDLPSRFCLNRRESERQFALATVELKEIVSRDGMDCCLRSRHSGFAVTISHGSLPEIILPVDVADRLGREVVNPCASLRIRRELADAFAGVLLLLPSTSKD